MNQFVFANNVQTTLAAAITSPTQTTIELTSSANIPAIPAGQYWALTLNDAATQSFFEIVYVTSTSGATLQVLRGMEGTTARTWAVNDLAYACATAGVLASFLSQAAAGEFVELSPPTQQTGSIDISGPITAGPATFAGVDVGGALSGATSGSFSGDVTASDFIASKAYANTAIGSLPLQFNGGATIVGVGPSSGLSANGITATVLAIGAVSSGKVIAIDTFGNLSAYNNLYAGNTVYAGTVEATDVYSGGNHVVDSVSSPDGSISVVQSGGALTLAVANSGRVAIGGVIISDGNGGYPSISLPNYGQWFVEVLYGIEQTSNTNLNVNLDLIGGTITSGFESNATGVTAFNSNAWITVYGKGHTTVNNQTLTFGFYVTGGSISASPAQPWTVRATRTA